MRFRFDPWTLYPWIMGVFVAAALFTLMTWSMRP